MVSKGGYSITTEQNKMDIDFIHSFLTRSYWAEGITKEIVARSIRGSLCFGVFRGGPPSHSHTNARVSKQASAGEQVGFARMVTDEATFAYLADVFIIEDHRGRGLSK